MQILKKKYLKVTQDQQRYVYKIIKANDEQMF